MPHPQEKPPACQDRICSSSSFSFSLGRYNYNFLLLWQQQRYHQQKTQKPNIMTDFTKLEEMAFF